MDCTLVCDEKTGFYLLMSKSHKAFQIDLKDYEQSKEVTPQKNLNPSYKIKTVRKVR